MYSPLKSLSAFSLGLLLLLPLSRGQDTEPAAKINALIAQMTPAEKAAQLQAVNFKALLDDNHFSPKKCQEKLANGIGEISAFGSSNNLSAPEIKAALTGIQDFLRTKTRLGIPAIPHDEFITGLPVHGATTYPQMIGMACTWDPELIRENAAATREAALWLGAKQALSPVLDVHNNAHWGRIEEAFGEEPYLTATDGLAFIQGLQGPDLRNGIGCTAKHFAGYGADTSDMAHFRDEVLMPHEIAVRVGHISSVMSAYHLFQGIPCSASDFLLSDILRKEWNFDGIVVSDYYAIKETVSKYHIGTYAVAARDCLHAGADIDLPDGSTYNILPEAMASGTIPASLVDQSVRRVLADKMRLGLMDAGQPDKSTETYDINSSENRARSYKAACETLVLLKNEDNTLPLSKSVRSIAVVGPNADSYYSLLGDYTHQMLTEFWSRMPADPNSPKLITLLSGLEERVGTNIRITYSRGCDWSDPLDKVGQSGKEAADPRAARAQRKPMEPAPSTNPKEALRIAAQSDVIIAAMGENRYLCGEVKDRADVRLPGEQEKFVRELIATGKPVILVVFGGRPMILTNIASGCKAIIYAWYPGQEGGCAIADVLLGRANPGGKLTITLPRSEQQIPISYRAGYSPQDPPLYPFGYGISYTTYKYSNLQAPVTARTTDSGIPIQFQLTNTGAMEGVEISQLYLSPVSPQPGQRPMELKGFSRVDLKPGESKTVQITLSPQQLAHHDAAGTLTLVPESYQLEVGASSTDIRLKSPLTLTGEKLTLPHRDQFFSQTTLR